MCHGANLLRNLRSNSVFTVFIRQEARVPINEFHFFIKHELAEMHAYI